MPLASYGAIMKALCYSSLISLQQDYRVLRSFIIRLIPKDLSFPEGIEVINILLDLNNNSDIFNPQFEICPGGYLDSFNIRNYGDFARIRNIAVEHIVKSLYKATSGRVAITTSDRDSGHFTLDDLFKRIYYSPFTVLKRNVLPEFDLSVERLPVTVEQFDDSYIIRVQDQVFSLSSFNTEGVNTLQQFQSALEEVFGKDSFSF